MNDQPPRKSLGTRVKESTTFKVIAIGFLVLILLIPTGIVRSLIRERERRQADVVREISSKWGAAQIVAGPVISLPYEKLVKGGKGKSLAVTEYLHILPNTLDIDGDIASEIRYRGMYEAVLYNTKLNITGFFTYPDFKALGISARNIKWDRATIALGLSDLKGIKSKVVVRVNDKALPMNPGMDTSDVLQTGLSARLPDLRKAQKIVFDVDLDLNGSQRLAFVPVGKDTSISLASSWDSPSFDGAFLPEKRSVGADGFKAEWKVLHLNRNYPQVWTGGAYKIGDSTFGVKLYIPADAYQKATRTVKYAAMFIAFTFMAFFFSEVMKGIRIHPFQYLLIGLALIIFYTLLLSISEHLSFGKGYLISSVAIIGLVTGYARAILRKGSLAVIVGSILTILYGYLYILLQLEDYALLLGSIGLFVILAAVMYLTRRINWYDVGSS